LSLGNPIVRDGFRQFLEKKRAKYKFTRGLSKRKEAVWG
jgi:hypothetical protein